MGIGGMGRPKLEPHRIWPWSKFESTYPLQIQQNHHQMGGSRWVTHLTKPVSILGSVMPQNSPRWSNPDSLTNNLKITSNYPNLAWVMKYNEVHRVRRLKSYDLVCYSLRISYIVGFICLVYIWFKQGSDYMTGWQNKWMEDIYLKGKSPMRQQTVTPRPLMAC